MPSSNNVRKVTSENYPTDAGREGELIFRFVYQMAGCAKPVKRLWISSMEDAAIREGFANLCPDSDYDALYQSALCRAKADWLVGINATRLFSVLYHKTLTVGRVQTPTLKMLVDRDAKILRFQKERYYTVGIQSGSLKADSGRIASMDEADTLKNACAGASAICSSVKREKKTEQPPKLYDLTTLQREANRLFGFTAKQTLDYAQQLYEKKLLTYPRTDSQYLTEDMGQTAQHLVSDLLGLPPFAQGLDLTPEVGRILNSKKVSDHHAIIPTSEFVKQGFTGLAESECKLMNLVCSKLLCAVAAPHEYETVTAVFSCAGNEFTAKGKTVLVPGWKEIDQRFRATLKADTEEEVLNTLPELAEGQSFRVTSTVSEHFTSPPKAYTEDTLLSAMERAGAEDMPEDKVNCSAGAREGGLGQAERKGLGTPATRAAILEKLVQMGFVQRKGKQLVPTKDGINLAVVLPESLTSPALTAEWENRLTEIAKGNADPDEFMAEIEAQVRQLVKTYSCISADTLNGQPDNYEGRQDFGDGDGSLIQHIQSYHEYYAKDENWKNFVLHNKGPEAWEQDKAEREMVLTEFILYLKQHCNLSAMEQAATAALREGQNISPEQAAYYNTVVAYVQDCRPLLNQGQYDLPEPPKLADFDQTLQDYKAQVQAEIEQEAAAAGMTVEEYAAAGFEAPQQDSFSIYQLRNEDSTRDYRFEPYDRLQAAGLTVDKSNYTEVYTAPLTAGTTLEDIYRTFNVDYPADFKGHSLSVSDVVVLHQNGQDTAHYCDSVGFQQVPEFLRENPLRTAELSTEQNENMIDGVLNNAPSLGELEAKAKAGEQISLTDLAAAVKAEEKAPKAKKSRAAKPKKPSIRAQLDAAKKEQSKQTPPLEKTRELEV